MHPKHNNNSKCTQNITIIPRTPTDPQTPAAPPGPAAPTTPTDPQHYRDNTNNI